MAPGVSRKMIVETLRNLERRGTGPSEPASEAAPAPQPSAPPAAPRAEPEPFRPFSLSTPAAFGAGAALGLVLGIVIGLLL
jgi:hypothetical protein